MNNIYTSICPKGLKEKDIRKTVMKIIMEDYAAGSRLRRLKYILFHKRIEAKFFKNILDNIKVDINDM